MVQHTSAEPLKWQQLLKLLLESWAASAYGQLA